MRSAVAAAIEKAAEGLEQNVPWRVGREKAEGTWWDNMVRAARTQLDRMVNGLGTGELQWESTLQRTAPEELELFFAVGKVAEELVSARVRQGVLDDEEWNYWPTHSPASDELTGDNGMSCGMNLLFKYT